MKIWITGVAGFLGSHIAEALVADGNEIWGNDNLICGDEKNISAFTNPEETTWHSGLNIYRVNNKSELYFSLDCRDYDGMVEVMNLAKPDVLVHCAATAHEGLSSFSPSFITKNIYEASVATFSAAIASGVKRIVFMSSMARYGAGSSRLCLVDGGWGEVQENPPFIERQAPRPIDPYGIAKVAAEQTLKVLAKTHGIKYSILVPHNIIGVRQRSIDPFRNVAAIMINRCKQGFPPIVYGDGKQTRCFSPVKDCIPPIMNAICGAADGEIVNIGPDSGNITIGELADKIRILTGMAEPCIHMPDRPNEVKHAYCSSDKSRKLLGYKEVQSLDDCLKEMVDYIQPAPFEYSFPIEITEGCPETWKKKLI